MTRSARATGATLLLAMALAVLGGCQEVDRFTIVDGTTGSSGPVAGVPDRLLYRVAPTDTVAGVTISPVIEVAVADAFGDTVPSATAVVSIAIGSNPSGGVLTGTTSVATASGIARFGDLKIVKAGAGYTLVVTSPGLTGDSTSLNITSGIASRMTFVTQPSSTTASALMATVRVGASDAFGNVVDTASLSIALTASRSGGNFSNFTGSSAVPTSGGIATFSSLRLQVAGPYVIRARANAGAPGAPPDIFSSGFSISPGAPAFLDFRVGPESTSVGADIAPAVQIDVLDSAGNVVTGTSAPISVTLTPGVGTAGAVLSGTTTVAAVAGVATFSALRIDRRGSYSLDASMAGLSASTSGVFQVGFFRTAATLSLSNARRLALGEFNGDGDLDIAVARTNSNLVSLLLGDGAGGFSEASGSPLTVFGTPADVGVGDLDGNGKLDLIVARGNDSTIPVLLGDGAGGLSPAATSPFSTGLVASIAIATATFNADAHQDFVLVGTTEAHLFLGNGAAGFSDAGAIAVASGGAPRSARAADFNGDGKTDVALMRFDAGNNRVIDIRLGDGAGGFSQGSVITAGEGESNIAAADFDGDGKIDIAFGDTSSVAVLLGDGAGSFTPDDAGPYSLPASPFTVDAGDVNGDGKPDLVVTLPGSGSGDMAVLLHH